MRTFYTYESYAAWRKSTGGNSTEPVKLVGSGVGTWIDTYEAQAEIARLTAERDQALARAAAAAQTEMRGRLELDKTKPEYDDFDRGWNSCVEAMASLNPDAQKALDKMLAQAREDAIREALKIAEEWHQVTHIRAGILALLTDGGRDK